MRNKSCHGEGDVWCGTEPALKCELADVRLSDSGSLIDNRWIELHESHAYICPDDASLALLAELGPIVEIGVGSGYWARLLRDRGVDVVAIDVRRHPNPWTDVILGDHTLLPAYDDRTLLMVRPFNGQSEDVVEAWSGSRMVVVQQGPFPNPHNGLDDQLISLMASNRWALVGSQPLWDVFDKGFLLHNFKR